MIVLTPKQSLQLALVVVLVSIGGCYYLKGRGDNATSTENTALRADARATAASVQISSATAAEVDLESHDTRTRTAAAVEAINPPPVHSDPAATADVLRLAREAHDRAIRSACRVQRTGDCPAPAGAADGR